ncbi:MAG: glucosaminidase domain-containing protein [Clostridiales bacterium]|nr:glucosaminidase domain-containing protein [Clostridiales bacterium]
MKRNKIWKKLTVFVLAFALIFGSMQPVSVSATTTYKKSGKTYKYTGASYKVYYNNKLVSKTKKPGVLINGNIMIPYKATLVNKGPKMSYKYNKAKKTLTLTYNGTKVKLVANKKYMWVNGVKTKIRTAPLFVNFSGSNTFMIPARAVLEEAFGFGYEYVKSKKAVYITAPSTSTSTISASSFKNMTTAQFIAVMGPIAQADYHSSGVLASVTLAQAILESGWGKSELAQSANNLFGMKTSLSGNTWSGSVWDGSSCVTIKTSEEVNGKTVTVSAKFRKYSSIVDSVADHSAYLVNAKDGSSYRYAGLTSTTSYKKQLTIIKNGGYATSSNYVSQLTNLIEKYNLDKYDK